MLKIPRWWTESGGKFTSAYADERQETALEAARKLIAAGYANPDIASAPPNQTLEWMQSGTVSMIYTTYVGIGLLYQERTNQKAEFDSFQVPGYSGGQGAGWAGGLNNNIVGIPKSSQDRIETLLKVSNYFAAPFGSEEYLFLYYGTEGKDYKLVGSDPVLLTANPSYMGLGTRYLGAPPVAIYFAPPLSDLAETVWKSTEAFLNTAVVEPSVYLYSKTNERVGNSIMANMTSLESDIIYGRQPVSAWRPAVQQYLASGGNKIAAEFAAAYAANGGHL